MRVAHLTEKRVPGVLQLVVSRSSTEMLGLELTEQDALALRSVLQSIAGPNRSVVRQAAEGLDDALDHVGVMDPYPESCVTGTLQATGFAPSTLNPNP